MNQNEQTEIGKKSKVNLSILAASVAIIAAGAIEWATLKAQVSSIARDQWTVGAQKSWSFQLQKLNPNLNVPIPTDGASAQDLLNWKTNGIFAWGQP